MKSVYRLMAAPLLLGAVAFAGVGCEALGLEDKDDRRSSDRSRGSDRISSRDTDVRGGVGDIPTRARRLDTVRGEKFTETFDRDGTLYVLDRDDGRVVYRGRVRRDDRFSFDPQNDEMRINNDRVGGSDLNLRAGHEYEFHLLDESDERDERY